MTAPRILVLGCAGGVGTTVLAAALAARATRRGLASVVVETARGGLDVVCGVDGWPGVRLDDLGELEGEADGRALLALVPRPGGLAVLAHAADSAGPEVAPDHLPGVLAALADHADLVVVDAGRAGAADPRLVADADEVLLVVGPGPHRLALAAGLVPRLDALAGGGVRAVLVGAVGDAATVAEHLGATAASMVPRDPGVDRDLAAAGCPGRHARGGIGRAVDGLLDELLPDLPGTDSARRAVRRVAR